MYSVYSFVEFGHFENDWSQRDPQVVQCLYSFYILRLIGPGGTHRVYSVYSLKLIGKKGTNRIVLEKVNILKIIGLIGTLRFVQCAQFCTVSTF